jgi:adenylate cyclase
VIGTPLPALMPASNIDFGAYMQLVRENNQKQIVDAELDSPAHGRMSLNVKFSPLKDGSQSTQGVTIVLNDFTERRENEAMLGVMRRYLPPEMVDNIHQIAALALGGERRVTTCMFVEVRPLATFPPDLRPQQIMEMLNRYLSLATDCIHAAGGVIDKYMGQEIMGLFNSQLNPCDDHAARALDAGLRMRDAFIDLYHELGIDPDPHFYRIGIHSGVATLGNVGSEIRRDFTAIGDTINLSKRLEENAASGQIILSEVTRQLVGQNPGTLNLADVRLVEREPIQVKGRQQLTRIYEVFRVI